MESGHLPSCPSGHNVPAVCRVLQHLSHICLHTAPAVLHVSSPRPKATQRAGAGPGRTGLPGAVLRRFCPRPLLPTQKLQIALSDNAAD